ncbi:MAG: RluA family pseudouridine synthase [Verrucomicrobiota bacterium]
MKRRATTRIGPDDAGATLPEFLQRRFTYHTRERWLELILERRVLLNGKPAALEQTLAAGDHLEYIADDIPEPPVSTNFSVVHEDSDMLVVDKPGNLPCHPAGRFFHNTLWRLLQQNGYAANLRFVHRLDRETSGLVVIAKSATAARTLGRQFERREVKKVYQVLVEGQFPHTLTAEGEMLPDTTSEVRKKRRLRLDDSPDRTSPRYAFTEFRRLEFQGDLTLVEARPTTGRLHQIRASLHALGFPVAGDKLYGLDETLYLRFIRDALSDDDRATLRFPRQALHAAQLILAHPTTRKPMHFCVNFALATRTSP